jgi:transposase InsO family protein
MQRAEALSVEQIRQFLGASSDISLQAQSREETYAWVEATLRAQQYKAQAKAVRGLILQYVAKMTGLSAPQVDRLVRRFKTDGQVAVTSYRRHRFTARFTRADVELLAAVDEAHETLSGPATKRILEREFKDFGRKQYERLATISVGHLYNLRKQRRYRECRLQYVKTRPVQVAIGERRKPDPQGRPGFLRVDTVHQGDSDAGQKGVYHINAVDEVTQWQVVACTPAISEAWLLPVLESMLEQFPFVIRNFHSDNGSEFINHTVARLLDKLLIEQTKSRPRRSNDNGLVETKNAAVIRKLMGFNHIAAPAAQRVQSFYEQHLNPYLNCHRPCAQADVDTLPNGKRIRRYKRYQTPLETLLALDGRERFLKPGITAEALQSLAARQSDTDAAKAMQQARHKLFNELRRSA